MVGTQTSDAHHLHCSDYWGNKYVHDMSEVYPAMLMQIEVQCTSKHPAQYTVGRMIIYAAVGLVENVNSGHFLYDPITDTIGHRLFQHIKLKSVLHHFAPFLSVQLTCFSSWVR